MEPFKRRLCRGAEKNSGFSQTSKMEFSEKIVKRFKGINYFCNKLHLSCLMGFENTSEEHLSWKYPENECNYFCKVAGGKALISMKQDSTGDKM